jgi:hypothetical protein
MRLAIVVLPAPVGPTSATVLEDGTARLVGESHILKLYAAL